MIYIASPYNSPFDTTKIDRYEAVRDYVADCYKRELPVYSPIVHNHPIAITHELPGTWEFWAKINLPMLRLCDTLHVLCLDGWRDSHGVNAEIEEAIRLNLSIYFVVAAAGKYELCKPPFPYNKIIKS